MKPHCVTYLFRNIIRLLIDANLFVTPYHARFTIFHEVKFYDVAHRWHKLGSTSKTGA